jgi:hypothetical protein
VRPSPSAHAPRWTTSLVVTRQYDELDDKDSSEDDVDEHGHKLDARQKKIREKNRNREAKMAWRKQQEEEERQKDLLELAIYKRLKGDM